MAASSKVFVLGLAIGVIVLVSASALANPSMPVKPDTSFSVQPDITGIGLLFFMNIFVNLALYCLFFLLLTSGYKRARRSFRNPLAFLLGVIGVVCLVTLVGAFVDFALVMGTDPWLIQPMFIVFDPANWALAQFIIFISVAFPTYAGLRSSAIRSAYIGASMCAVNLAWWVLTGQFGYNFAFLAIVMGIVVSPVLLWIMVERFRYGTRSEPAADLNVAGSAPTLSQSPVLSYRGKTEGPEQH